MPTDSQTLTTAGSLEDYFRTAVAHAIEQYDIDGETDTRWYISRLLTDYARSSRFFDEDGTGCALTPLAEYLRRSVEADSDAECRQHLQRLGDVSLFISGLFSGAIARRAVGVDYYLSMGTGAYSSLANAEPRSSRDRALRDIFRDLSINLEDYVTAISTIPNSCQDDNSLFDLLDAWQRSRDPALERRLAARGVITLDTTGHTH
jgi:hypothetical protein